MVCNNKFVFQRAYTSAPGEGGVVSFKDYDRKFSSHAVSCHVSCIICRDISSILVGNRSTSTQSASTSTTVQHDMQVQE